LLNGLKSIAANKQSVGTLLRRVSIRLQLQKVAQKSLTSEDSSWENPTEPGLIHILSDFGMSPA
jgi:hypothetical protein